MNRRNIMAGILALACAACSSAGGRQDSPAAYALPDAGTAAAKSHASVRFTFRIPRHRHRRPRPHYISPSTQSLVVSAQSSANNVTSTYLNTNNSPNCVAAPLEAELCTVTLSVLPGAYTITVNAYDAPQTSAVGSPAGTLLSTNSIAAAVRAGRANAIGMTLDAVVSSIGLTASPTDPSSTGSASTGVRTLGGVPATLLLAAYDPDGNVIVGPGSPSYSLTVQNGTGGIAAAQASGGNPNAFTLSSQSVGSATLVATVTPLTGSPISTNVSLTAVATTTLLAGQVGTGGTLNGTGTGAQFDLPNAIAYDPDDSSLYVADGITCTIRRVTLGGVVTTVAGSAHNCDSTGSDLNNVTELAYDHDDGYLYAADTFNCTIDRIPVSGGTFSRIAGTAGTCNNTGTDLKFPSGVVYAGGGTLYVADFGSCAIRKVSTIDSAPTVTTFAGTLGTCDASPGDLDVPWNIAYDGSGALYVTVRCAVDKVTIAGAAISMLAGGTCGFADGTGSAAEFYGTQEPIGFDATDGSFYVGDNCTIRRVTSAGTVITLMGAESENTYNVGTPLVPASGNVQGLAVLPGSAGSLGTLYFADNANQVIRSIAPLTLAP